MQKSFARRSYVRSKPTTCTILQLYLKQSLHLGSTMKAMESGNNKKPTLRVKDLDKLN